MDLGKLFYFILIGYENESLSKFLKKLEKSQPMPMDRWKIEISTSNSDEKGDPIPCTIFNNYFSIGVVSVLLLKYLLHSDFTLRKHVL